MINVEFIREWIVELRSGKYKQYLMGLRTQKSNRYCCWGVACELAKIPPIANAWGGYSYEGNTVTPPDSVVIKSGLNEYQYVKTIVMNDTNRIFSEIADYLEGLINGNSDVFGEIIVIW